MNSIRFGKKASLKSDDTYDYVFVPIEAENNYISHKNFLRDSLEKVDHVSVFQILVVRKESDSMAGSVILTLIPAQHYYDAHQNSIVDQYIDGENFHGNFTGFVLYNDRVRFTLLAVDQVIDGELDWGFSRWTVEDKEELWNNYRKLLRDVWIGPADDIQHAKLRLKSYAKKNSF